MTHGPIQLNLVITDTDLCDVLSSYENERERHDFATAALKIGSLALAQAQGRIDAERIRNEGERILENISHALAEHQRSVSKDLSSALTVYFDPESGKFSERVERLVRKDGELERLLRSQVGGESSELATTLSGFVGEHSPLIRILDPEASDGLLTALSQSLEKTLGEQRERILNEFSLNNKEGALSRLVLELTESHGEVSEALEKRIDEVVREFSLDHQDSALSRLVGRVEQAQRKISSEFSLDEEGSALARMKRELLEVIGTQREANERFHAEVLQRLADMVARKEEAARSTRHGLAFEDSLLNQVSSLAQTCGDVVSSVGNTTGRIKHCKKGDIVIELGREHVAADSRIVLEAKQDASYTMERALLEIEEARKNREASVGLFVFSAASAPAGLQPFARYGDDLIVTWDADDARSDVFLIAGISVAKALCARVATERQSQTVDFGAIELSILEIEKQVGGLDEIDRSAQTIRNGSEKILNRARIMRQSISNQVGELTGAIAHLKSRV